MCSHFPPASSRYHVCLCTCCACCLYGSVVIRICTGLFTRDNMCTHKIDMCCTCGMVTAHVFLNTVHAPCQVYPVNPCEHTIRDVNHTWTTRAVIIYMYPHVKLPHVHMPMWRLPYMFALVCFHVTTSAHRNQTSVCTYKA